MNAMVGITRSKVTIYIYICMMSVHTWIDRAISDEGPHQHAISRFRSPPGCDMGIPRQTPLTVAQASCLMGLVVLAYLHCQDNLVLRDLQSSLHHLESRQWPQPENRRVGGVPGGEPMRINMPFQGSPFPSFDHPPPLERA